MDLGMLLDDWLGRRRVQLGLALRVTVAATVTLAVTTAVKLPLPLWAVLTAVIVTQGSVGRSLRATIDYLLATLGGVVYGGTIAVLVPHASEVALLAVLALAVAPLALVAAVNCACRPRQSPRSSCCSSPPLPIRARWPRPMIG
jgi:uncharacterized membrane protein YccC